jgi:hypothetical protein
MKNTECVIYITTKRGRTWSYLKENNGWTQTGPTGIVHRLSAEQLLSHLLPPLAADNPGHLSVRVERRVEKDELSIARARRSGSVVAGSHDASGQS